MGNFSIYTPVTLLNLALALFPDKRIHLESDDKITVLIPMYNEEDGARTAVSSVLRQSCLPDEVVISINGCTDETLRVVLDVLQAYNYMKLKSLSFPKIGAILIKFKAKGQPDLKLIVYKAQIGKATSINNAMTYAGVQSDRILVMDGDTELDSDFIENARKHFYSLKIINKRGYRKFLVEDSALQSGTVFFTPSVHSSPLYNYFSMSRNAEFTFAQFLIKKGQTKELFGGSRVFTVVGAGFFAKRSLLNVPVSTQTEDHDFTLVTQNLRQTRVENPMKILHEKNIRLPDGRALANILSKNDELILIESGNVRLVLDSIMHTVNPPHMNGMARQLKRWHRGAFQNLFKRAGTHLRMNVLFACLFTNLESIISSAILVMIPLAILFNAFIPSLGFDIFFALKVMAADFLIMLMFFLISYYNYFRLIKKNAIASLALSIKESFFYAIPSFIYRFFNSFLYLLIMVLETLKFALGKSAEGSDAWVRPH